MRLTTEHIEFIRQDLLRRGIKMAELRESLLDHLCCYLENSTESNFSQAYSKAIASFGDQGLIKIQAETLIYTTPKRKITMKKLMYLLGYVAVILITTGILFKLNLWFGASVMLTTGIALLNLGFLPMYFYDRYRQAVSE